MANAELSRAFERIADLLEIDGADRFRINSYRRVARSLKDATTDVADLAEQGKLSDLPGVGKGAAQRIGQYLANGTIDVLAELERKLPPGLPDLLNIPGLGPKKVSLVYHELGVEDVAGLSRAIESGQLQALPGLGAVSARKIAEGIAFLKSSGGRTPLGVARPIAQAVAETVRAFQEVYRVAIAGSLRRGCETIGDIDILCESSHGKKIVERFTQLDGVKRVLAAGTSKGSVTIESDAGREIQVDLRVVPTESFGAALQYFTGSKEHNVRLREIAVKKKWRLNEYGLFDGEEQMAGRAENDIYEKLGVAHIPPELREDRGEFELDPRALSLVTENDIRGDLHMHTVASDGKNTIEEMAEAARTRGYEYIAICDHSKSSTIANGLSIERMSKHIREIRDVDRKIDGVTVLVGCECDILPDGSLDYPDDVLAQCDWVVASIHSAMGSAQGQGKRSPTDRTLSAIENRFVSAIGHPTGRLIHRRAPMEIDLASVVEAAARTHTLLEVNASWPRLDLKDTHIRQALAAGVMLTINTDAHRAEGLASIDLGVITARRGGATAKDVANCLALDALKNLIAKQRG